MDATYKAPDDGAIPIRDREFIGAAVDHFRHQRAYELRGQLVLDTSTNAELAAAFREGAIAGYLLCATNIVDPTPLTADGIKWRGPIKTETSLRDLEVASREALSALAVLQRGRPADDCGALIDREPLFPGGPHLYCRLAPGHGGPHRAAGEPPTSTETDG